MKTAKESLRRLQQGNDRFVNGESGKVVIPYADRDLEGLLAKRPVAAIIACSDGRVPTERIFDQDIGDLFVIRAAGNFATDSEVGSIELAMEKFDVCLAIVMGHSGCGAVAQTLSDIAEPGQEHPRCYTRIVERMRPAIEGLVADNRDLPDDQIAALAIRANVRASMRELESRSSSLRQARQDNALMLVGAEYQMSTGRVEFFDA